MVDFSEVLKKSGEQIGLTKEQINSLGESFSNLTEKMGVNINVTQKIVEIYNGAETAMLNTFKTMAGIKDSLIDTSKMTDKQVNALSMLNAGLIKTSRSFESFGQSQTGLNTFAGQFEDLVVGIKAGKTPLEDMRKLASSFGIDIKGIKSVDELGNFLIKTAKNMAESADNALRFQNAILMTAASAGNLGKVINQAGDSFENINSVIVAQGKYLSDVEKATQKPKEAVESYYVSLAKIPGALESNVTGFNESQKSVNMLTAAMQYSEGSGRKFEDVVKDLDTAFVDYNLVGEDALRFTSRIGQLSNDYNIQLDKVRAAITSTSQSLRMFGHDGDGASKMMEGASKVMNNYIQALKDTGISGAAAMDVITNMTKKVGDLDIASRSFISSQTGGPGGLRGAFKIEQLMREGKMDEVMEKVRKTMTQQFGKVVSVEEASKSESAASALVKQRQMLMKGPLGGLARNEQEAGRLVEAFASMGKGGSTKDLKDILQDTMKQGNELQKQTATPISMMRADTNAMLRIMQASGMANLQQMMAGASGKTFANEPSAVQARKQAISNAMSAGATSGGESANLIGSNERMPDNAVKFFQEKANDLKDTFGVIPTTVEGFVQHLNTEVFEEAEKKLEDYKAETDRKREQMKLASGKDKANLAEEIKSRENEANKRQSLIRTTEEMYSPFKQNTEPAVASGAPLGAMQKAARSRYDFGEETAPAMVAAAIPETAPAVAATGGAPGRRGGEEKSEVKVKLEPETIVIELRDQEGNKISANEHSLAVTSVPEGK